MGGMSPRGAARHSLTRLPPRRRPRPRPRRRPRPRPRQGGGSGLPAAPRRRRRRRAIRPRHRRGPARAEVARPTPPSWNRGAGAWPPRGWASTPAARMATAPRAAGGGPTTGACAASEAPRPGRAAARRDGPAAAGSGTPREPAMASGDGRPAASRASGADACGRRGARAGGGGAAATWTAARAVASGGSPRRPGVSATANAAGEHRGALENGLGGQRAGRPPGRPHGAAPAPWRGTPVAAGAAAEVAL